MVAQGRVQNGVVVLADGVHFPEGQLVTVLATPMADSAHQQTNEAAVSPERKAALLQLIGIWKSDKPPNDEQVEEMIYQERMKKYG